MRRTGKYLLPVGFAAMTILFLPQATVTSAFAFVTEDADSLLIGLLKKEAIYNDDFIRNTFYTWTTGEQITALRKDKKLLTRSVSSSGELSLFDLSLKDSSLMKNPLAQMLQEDRYAKKRFAWTCAWPTAMGWEKEKYGDHLLKITIKEEAFIGCLDRDDTIPLRFYDMKGNALDQGEVLANRDRIAVIYHTGLRKGMRSEMIGTTAKGEKRITEIPFREYVILNEDMVSSWSYGTEEIKKEISGEVALLKKLYTYAAIKNITGKYYGYHAFELIPFAKKSYSSSVKDHYYACTCFENDFYFFNKNNLGAIYSRMNKIAAAQSQPLVK